MALAWLVENTGAVLIFIYTKPFLPGRSTRSGHMSSALMSETVRTCPKTSKFQALRTWPEIKDSWFGNDVDLSNVQGWICLGTPHQ